MEISAVGLLGAELLLFSKWEASLLPSFPILSVFKAL